MRATRRESAICIPHSKKDACLSDIDRQSHSAARHCHVDFDEDECRITEDRLALVRDAASAPSADRCALSDRERYMLQSEQNTIRATLFDDGPSRPNGAAAVPTREAAIDEERPMIEGADGCGLPRDGVAFEDERLTDIGFQLNMAKIRSRLDGQNDGVLGIQARPSYHRLSSLKELVPRRKPSTSDTDVHVEDVSYVRKPDMKRIVEEYDQLTNHPRYTLRQVVLSRRFQLYIHRFANAQFSRTLLHPTLPQPGDLYAPPHMLCRPCAEVKVTEKRRTRKSGHRFIVAADTQFGILMDGFAMERPSWRDEIEISRRCVRRINDMRGPERPLFVIVCGDLVDTESSFSGAIASWKKIMTGWERSLIFDQQVRWVFGWSGQFFPRGCRGPLVDKCSNLSFRSGISSACGPASPRTSPWSVCAATTTWGTDPLVRRSLTGLRASVTITCRSGPMEVSTFALTIVSSPIRTAPRICSTSNSTGSSRDSNMRGIMTLRTYLCSVTFLGRFVRCHNAARLCH